MVRKRFAKNIPLCNLHPLLTSPFKGERGGLSKGERGGLLLLTLSLLCLLPLSAQSLTEEGVSWALAQHRKATISNLHYGLTFAIPEDKTESIEGQVTVSFDFAEKDDVILDFNEEAQKVHSVATLKGKREKPCKWQFVNGHIILPKAATRKGRNTFVIRFTAGNQGLNRRDGYVYTLFVPDRAHTVFPCFDQPNLKATFHLQLRLPEKWTAVSNGEQIQQAHTHCLHNAYSITSEASSLLGRAGGEVFSYALDTPIPTYLFAFAAGEFKYETHEEDGLRIGAYHRETDSLRIAQLPEIMHQVCFAMRWQEQFTGIPYPFPKYDLVILPGFQFGGMEHVGATFYNDNTIFLPAHPTPDEQLRRTELIAHETSHMWFGDAVTMNWFDDVWTKEVFANYFAAEITAPLFPTLNHDLNFLKTYTAAAISQDRTEGRTSIRQPLDNLRYAGLVYNNIIYNKAPVMMRKMVEIMGKEAFQRGIQKYVARYKYDNATWDDLIAILDAETPADLKAFSRQWVDEAHWPRYQATGIDDARLGKEYGFFSLTHDQCEALIASWQNEPDGTRRQALLMTLHENYLAGHIGEARWLSALITSLKSETDPLTALTITSYMSEPLWGAASQAADFEKELLALSASHPLQAVRTQILRLLISEARSPETISTLHDIWQQGHSPLLSENDFMNLALELAVRLPEQADSLLATQRSRLTNPDRLAQFSYIARAVNPSESERDALFQSLSLPENRRIEPWTQSLLYYLNHPLRDTASTKYIRPALELLPDIQRTGDIFFPQNWCSSLLAGHRSPEAYREVETYLADHPELMPLLKNKILQAEYYLKRANTLPEDEKQREIVECKRILTPYI